MMKTQRINHRILNMHLMNVIEPHMILSERSTWIREIRGKSSSTAGVKHPEWNRCLLGSLASNSVAAFDQCGSLLGFFYIFLKLTWMWVLRSFIGRIITLHVDSLVIPLAHFHLWWPSKEEGNSQDLSGPADGLVSCNHRWCWNHFFRSMTFQATNLQRFSQSQNSRDASFSGRSDRMITLDTPIMAICVYFFGEKSEAKPRGKNEWSPQGETIPSP